MVRQKCWFKIVSTIIAFSFLTCGPSQANLTDALKPPRTESRDITSQLEAEFTPPTSFSITNPETISIAEDIGRVKEIFKGRGGRLIINIQDAHCNFEAQTNISQILDVLVKNGLRVVALEGSTGDIDPSLFTTFPDEAIRKEVAAYFMKKGKINGAEYLAITSKNPPKLYGAETKEYYLANLSTFVNTLKGRTEIKTACVSVKNVLNKLKSCMYSKELRELDAKAEGFRDTKLDFIDYCRYLRKLSGSNQVPAGSYANLALFYQADDIEKKINFTKVEEERASVITSLEKALTQKQLEELFSKSVSFRRGRISALGYHTYLRLLAQSQNIDFEKYPNLGLYVRYLIIYEKVDSVVLLGEINNLERDIKERFFTGNDQRKLDKLSYNIRILEKMLDISMSKDDVEYYQRNKDDFKSAAFVNFIKAQVKKYKIAPDYNPNFNLADRYLPDLENFYRIADSRDDAIIENTLKKMDQEHVQVVALITGGYHTAGISERLRNRGISYIIISPRITKADKDNPYLSILSSEKVPEEGSLNINSKNLAINSGMEKDGDGYGTDEATFAREVMAALWERSKQKSRRKSTDEPVLAAANADPSNLELAQRLAFNDAPPGMVFEMDAIETDTVEKPSVITVTGFSFVGEPDSSGNREAVVTIAKPFDLPADVFGAANDLIEWQTGGVPLDDPARDLKLHALSVLKQHRKLSPAALVRQLQSGKAAPDYCIAALMQKGYLAACAHRGDVLSAKPVPTIPINIGELEKAVHHLTSHRLVVTLNAEKEGKKAAKPNPIYLIPEGELRETVSTDTRYMRIIFKASEGLSAGRPMTFEIRVQGENPPALYRIEGPPDNETETLIQKTAQEISRIHKILEEYFSAKRNHAQANTAQVKAAAVHSLKKTALENAEFELAGLRRKLELEPANAAAINQQIMACKEKLTTAKSEAKAAQAAYDAANGELRDALGKMQAAKAKGFPDLHGLLIEKGEYRESLLGAYLGGQDAIAFCLGIFWNLKRTENLLAVLQNPDLQKRLKKLSMKLQGFASIEEKAFDNADPAIFSSRETDTIGQALVSLSDIDWTIQEVFKAVEGVEDLSGRRRQEVLDTIPGMPTILAQEGIAAGPEKTFTLPQPISRQLINANTILERMDAVMDSIDYQMETRGRDSLGFTGTFTFQSKAEFEKFLGLLEKADRLDSDIRGLTPDEKERIEAAIKQLTATLATAEKSKQERIRTQVAELQNILSGKQRLGVIRERLVAERETAATGAEKAAISRRIEELDHIIATGTLKDEFLFRARKVVDMTNLSIRISDTEQDPSAPFSVTFVYKTAERVGQLGDNVARIREDIKFDRLFRILLGLDDKISAFTLLSHTRWASCGTISEQNCHPVDSEGIYQFADRAAAERQIYKFPHPLYPGNDITIAVLNGDITNYAELKKRYEETEIPGMVSRAISPKITTDTKVIPVVIESYLQKGYSLEEAVWLAGKEFEGSFAIQVSSHLEPGKEYLLQAGEGQELNIGISRDGFHTASENYGFVRETQEFVKLKPKPGEGIMAVVDHNLAPLPDNIKYCMFTREHKAMPTVKANRSLQDLQGALQAPIARAERLRQDTLTMANLLTANISAIPEDLRPEILLATAASIQEASRLDPSQNLNSLCETVRGLIQGIYGIYAPLSPHQETLNHALSIVNKQPAPLNLPVFSDSLSGMIDRLIAARNQMVTQDFATNFQRLAASSSIIGTLGSMQGALREAAHTTLDDTISDIKQKLSSFTTQLCGCANAASPELARAGVQYIYAARAFLVSIGEAHYAIQTDELNQAGLGQYIPKAGTLVSSLAQATDEMAKYTMMAKRFSKADISRTQLTGRDTYLPKGFLHYLIKELNQGPDMLRTTCRGKIGIHMEKGREVPDINLDAKTLPPAFIEKILKGEIRRIVFTGMGTADTAGGAVAEILRSYLIALNDILKEAGMPTFSIETLSALATNASAFDIREDMSDTLVVAISQSGGTTDTNAYLSKASLERGAGKGALLLGIINKRDSDMDKAIRNVKDPHGNPAGGVIYTGTGRDVEIAVASTKAFYAQIAAGAIVSMDVVRELAKKFEKEYPNKQILERVDALLVEDIKELQALPGKMRAVLDAIKDFPNHAVHASATSAALGCIEWAIMGGGPGYFAAKEGRIKLGELCFKSFQQLFLSSGELPSGMLNKTWIVVNGAGVHGRHMRFVNRTPQETLQMLEDGATVTFVTEDDDTRYDDPRFAVFRNGLKNLDSFKGAQMQQLLDTVRRNGFERLRFDMTADASAANLAHSLGAQFGNQLDGENAESLISGLAAWTRLTNGDLAATYERVMSIPGYDDLHFATGTEGANGLGLVEALCKQKGISLVSAQRLISDSHPVRLYIVKVPRCGERFAAILNTVVDHSLGYYSAVAMNDRAVQFGQGQFGDILNGMLKGLFNTGFPPEYSARFQLLHMAAEGRLQVKDLNRILGTQYQSRAEVVKVFQNFVQKCRDKLARGIDAVLHQAKFVTVGATRKGFELRIGSAIDHAIKSKGEHPLFEGADPLALRSLYELYSQDLKTQVQIVPVGDNKARIFVVCQDRDGVTDDIEALMHDAGCDNVGRDKFVFNIPSSQSTMQVFEVPISAEQVRSQGVEDAIIRGLIGRRMAALTHETAQYSGPKKSVPKVIEMIANSTIGTAASLTLPSSGKQLLRPEIHLSNTQFPPSVREQIASGKIRRIIFVGDATANNVAEAAKNNIEGYIRDIRNLLVKEAAERGTPLSKYDLHVEVSSVTAVEGDSFNVTSDMSDVLVIGLAGDSEVDDLITFMDSAEGHDARLLAITQEGNVDHKRLETFVAEKNGGYMALQDSGEGLYAPMAGISVYNMELARLFTEGVCAQAKKDSGLDLRLAGRIESVILDDVVELRYAMPLKQRRFLAALEDKSSPAAQAINQCADFWSHRKMHWKLLGDGPGFAITQYGRILVARLCGKATEGDYIENYKHKDTSTEAFAILLTANLRGTGDNYNLDVLSELEKWRAHESFVVIVCTEGDHRFDSFGIAQTDATGEVIKKRSAFPVVSVPQTSERFSGFLLGAATDAIIEAIASKMEGRASQIRNARSALVDFVDPRTATADMLVKRNFIVTLSDQCGPIVADMLKGMYNAYLPTDLTSRFIGLYTLLTGTMATEDAESYVGKDYANVGGIEAAYRDFCDLLGRMADTMSMRPAPEEPPSAPAAGVPRVGGPAAPAAPQLRAPALPVPAEPAPAPKQGSLPPVLSRALLNYNKEAARRLSREKIEMLAARGVIFKGDRDFIFIGPEVNEENIEPTAVIREGSILIGEHTHIGAKADIQGVVIDSTLAQSAVVAGDAVVISSNIDEHARIMRTGRRDSEMACMVFESSVGKGAEITDSVVTTQDFDGKKPETWAYDGNHKVTAQRTVIGAGSKVICSYLQNSGIGESCVLEWDDMESCRVGRDSKLSRLKSKLTRYGRKFIVDGRYRDGRPAPNEIQEAWMPSCVSILGAEGYYEGVFLSHFPAEDGTVHPLAFGPISCDRAVFSSFTGAGKTKGGEVVDSLDDPAVTSSQHNHMMTYPLLWPSRFKGMGSRLNVVGQPDYVSVNKTAPIGITALLPLSMPGAKPWTSVWGPVSGERSSPYWEDEEPISQFYLFPYLTADRLMELLQITAANQDAIADDIKEEGLTINTDRRNAINHLLLARADLFQKILDNAARVGLDEKDDIQRRFEQAISIARAQAQSGLWEIGDDGQLIHWTRDEAGQPVLRDDEATRAIVAELVAEDHMLEPSKWPTEDTIIQTEYDDPANRIPIDAEIFKEEEAAPAPQREMHPLPRRLTGFSNLFVHPSVLISDNVVVRNGTPGRPTIIWPGVTLRSGEVGSGAELFGVTGANIKIGEGTRCSSLRAETSSGSDINIGSDSFFAFQRIEANNGRSLRVGRDVTGRHACIVNEPVGDDTILYPGARLQDGYTGPRCKIGCPKIKVIGNPDGTGCDGVTAQHMASRLNHGSMLSKRTIHGGNIAAGGYAEEFRLERGVFWGTNRIGGPGITIGALSYVLADVPPDTTLRPFTVFQFRPKRDDPINLAGMLYGGSPSAISIGLRMGFGYPRRYATDAGQYEAVETEFERDECVLLAMLAGDLRLLGQQKMGQVPAEIEGLIKEVSAAVDYMRKDFEAAAGFPKDKARIIERAAAFQRLIEVAIPSVRQTLYARDDKAIMSILDAMAQTGMCLKNGSYRVRGGKFTDIRLHNHSTRPGWPRWDVQFKDPAPSTAIPITATAGTSGAAKAAVAGI